MEKKAQTGNPTSVMNLATLRALQGRHAEARAATERFLAMAEKNRYYHHLTYGAVRVYALGGDAEQAAQVAAGDDPLGASLLPALRRRPHARSGPEVARVPACPGGPARAVGAIPPGAGLQLVDATGSYAPNASASPL